MDGLSIGKLSQRSGVNIETIRYYERIGVMPAPARSAGGYRLYAHEHLKRLSFIRRGRELGFTLD
jgi:MerR family mercuric resistance operon transcriptional regulator